MSVLAQDEFVSLNACCILTLGSKGISSDKGMPPDESFEIL